MLLSHFLQLSCLVVNSSIDFVDLVFDHIYPAINSFIQWQHFGMSFLDRFLSVFKSWRSELNNFFLDV